MTVPLHVRGRVLLGDCLQLLPPLPTVQALAPAAAAITGLSLSQVLVLEGFYGFLAANTHSTPDSYCIPSDAMLELGVTYEV